MDNRKKRKTLDSSNLTDDPDYTFRKRLPPTLPKRPNDVYVNQKTPFIGQFNRCKDLLSTEKNGICIHGLGAAVNSAVNMALQLKSHYGGALVLEPTTSTVELIDDHVPRGDKGVHRTSVRKNSAIHIKVSFVIQPKKEK